MPMPMAVEFISEGEYLEIVAFKKIATTANFKPMTEGVELQVQFEEDGDKPILLLAWYIQQKKYCKQQRKWLL